MTGRHRLQRRHVEPAEQLAQLLGARPATADVAGQARVLVARVEQDDAAGLQVVVDLGQRPRPERRLGRAHRPIDQREEDHLIAVDVDRHRRRRLDRGARAQRRAKAFQAGAADLVEPVVAGPHIGEPCLERRLENEVVVLLGVRWRRGEDHQNGARRRRRGAQPDEPAQHQAGDQVGQCENDGRDEQPGADIDLAGLAIDAFLGAFRQRADGAQRAHPGAQVQRVTCPVGAVEAGRARRPRRRRGDVGGRYRPRGRRRVDQPPEAVERCDRREHVLSRLARDTLAQGRQALQHLDEEPGQREIRPGRVGGRVDQHQPATLAPFGGHQRRAVGEPRPGLGGKVERGLGKHLAVHPYVGGDGQSGERRAGCEGRERRRLVPRHRAAEHAAAAAQPDRHQVVGVASAVGDARAGEADQHAAGLQPVHQGGPVVADHLGDVGENQHGERPRQQLAQFALAHFAEGIERAFQIVQFGQQRLVGLGRARRHQPDRPAPPAFVDQHHAGGAARALDIDAHDVVAHLDRRLDDDHGVVLARGELHPLTRQHGAALAACAQPDLIGGAGDGALDGQAHYAGLVAGRPEQIRSLGVGVDQHTQAAPRGQRGGKPGVAAAEPIAQPHYVGATADREASERGPGGVAVDRPRLGLHRLGDIARLSGAQDAAWRGRAVGGGRRRGQQDDRPIGALGLVDQIGHRRLASVPAPRRRPTVVDRDEQ